MTCPDCVNRDHEIARLERQLKELREETATAVRLASAVNMAFEAMGLTWNRLEAALAAYRAEEKE